MRRGRSLALMHEEQHHDSVASFYTKRRLFDFIWEVPEELFLFRPVTWRRGWSIVDMGCGPSVSVARLIPRGFKLKKDTKITSMLSQQRETCSILQDRTEKNEMYYLGVDISRKMIESAKRTIPQGRFIQGDIGSVQLPALSFDVLLSLGALHHSLDHKKTINHWVRLVKTGGYLLLREPTIDAFHRGEGESPEEEGVQPGEIRASFRAVHCEVISEIYFNSQVFHVLNRALGKLFGSLWRETKWLWYPVVLLDALVSTTVPFLPGCKGLAVAMIVRKG